MSGSSNSNLEYGFKNPFVTNSSFVNERSTNNPATFSSNQIPTSCMKGGKRKNIKNTYKSMKHYKKRTARKRKSRKLRSRRRIYKGGYSQYQNNMPNTPSYSIGGPLSSGNLGMANPPPFKVLGGSANCVDNYNHFINRGFHSKGH